VEEGRIKPTIESARPVFVVIRICHFKCWSFAKIKFSGTARWFSPDF
jgi:hypothetical protein